MSRLCVDWPMVAFAIGFALIAAVPDELQGPVLFYIGEERAVNLIVAVGVGLLLPALIRVNLRLIRIAKGEGLD